MKDVKDMFRNFTTQVNDKLDTVINDIAELKSDLEITKKTVSDLQSSQTYTSDRLLDVEEKSLPQLRKYIDKKITELDEKITLSEIHDRKPNLLIYGIPPKANENIYETVNDILCHFLTISKEEAKHIPLVNAHRLPPANRDDSSSERQPPAVIIRFARMIDRDRLLNAYEHRPRQQSQGQSQRQQPVPPGSSGPSAPTAFSRVTIRTDLPPKMKRERGRLASIAYSIRKNNNLSTRIRIAGTHVLLQTRKIVRNGGTPERWTNWTE